MQRFAIILGTLALLAGFAGQAFAQYSDVNTLTIDTPPDAPGCDTESSAILTLSLKKWSTYTFFWVGTAVPPGQLSLEFCDNAGNALVATGTDADLTREGLAPGSEADGFRALDDIAAVTVHLSPTGAFVAGQYTLRNWIFEREVEERIYVFPEEATTVTACGNGTSDDNGVLVELSGGQAHEFIGNDHVVALAICEKDGLSYVNPVNAPGALRDADGEVHVFQAEIPATASAAAGAPVSVRRSATEADPAFTVIAYTPGKTTYPGVEVTPTVQDPATPEETTPEETTSEETAPEETTPEVIAPIDRGQSFATLGTLASLHRATLEDGTAAVDVYNLESAGTGVFPLRVTQIQVDAVDPGLVLATSDNRLIVKVSSHDIITFSMGPDADGKVYNLEMDEGLAGPVSASSTTRGGPPGEAYS